MSTTPRTPTTLKEKLAAARVALQAAASTPVVAPAPIPAAPISAPANPPQEVSIIPENLIGSTPENKPPPVARSTEAPAGMTFWDKLEWRKKQATLASTPTVPAAIKQEIKPLPPATVTPTALVPPTAPAPAPAAQEASITPGNLMVATPENKPQPMAHINEAPTGTSFKDDINPMENELKFLPEIVGTEYSFRQILDILQENKELILTIPSDQVEDLKRGLSMRKGKDNQKLKSAGLVISKDTIKYTIYPKKDEAGNEIQGFSDVQMKYGPRASITVLDIKKPDNSFLTTNRLLKYLKAKSVGLRPPFII